MFWSFHPFTDKTNNEHLPKPIFKVIRNSLKWFMNSKTKVINTVKAIGSSQNLYKKLAVLNTHKGLPLKSLWLKSPVEGSLNKVCNYVCIQDILGFWIRIPSQWNMDPGFRIPSPRLWDSTSKIFSFSVIWITPCGEKIQVWIIFKNYWIFHTQTSILSNQSGCKKWDLRRLLFHLSPVPRDLDNNCITSPSCGA